jgi:hypothetical protein
MQFITLICVFHRFFLLYSPPLKRSKILPCFGDLTPFFHLGWHLCVCKVLFTYLIAKLDGLIRVRLHFLIGCIVITIHVSYALAKPIGVNLYNIGTVLIYELGGDLYRLQRNGTAVMHDKCVLLPQRVRILTPASCCV